MAAFRPRLTFNRSLVNCVVQAVAGFGRPSGNAAGDYLIPFAFIGGTGNDHQVGVTFRTQNSATTPTGASFLATAFC